MIQKSYIRLAGMRYAITSKDEMYHCHSGFSECEYRE